MSDKNLYESRTRAENLFGALLLGSVGLLILVSPYIARGDMARPIWIVTQQVGALLIGACALSLVWELTSRRAFLDELLHKLGVSSNMRDAGVLQVGVHFSEIPWGEHFDQSVALRVFFSNGDRWESLVERELKTFLDRDDTSMVLILPDPNDRQVVAEIARRNQDRTVKKQKARMKDAHSRWQKRFQDALGDGHKVVSRAVAPRYTLYLFSQVAIISLYTHRPEKDCVWPFIVCEVGGSLYKELVTEFNQVHEMPPRDASNSQRKNRNDK